MQFDSVANFGFSSTAMNISKCCHWARTTNTGLLYPKERNSIGGYIPHDVPSNQIIGGDVSPASPTGLTPVARTTAEPTDYYTLR